MLRTVTFFIFFIPIVIGSVNCFSQQYPFVHYTPREGLVNNRARFVYQDSKGKIYVATYGGLSIYDGSRFTNYNTNNGLTVSLVNDVVEMGDDSVWVLLNDHHIQYIDRGQLKNFIPADQYTPLINQLVKSNNGFYYAIADEGIFRLENKKFVRMPLTDPSGSGAITTLMQAVEIDDKLYILFNPEYKDAAASLAVYDLHLNKVIACKRDLKIFGMFPLSPNEVWITKPDGIFIVNATTKDQSISLKPVPASFHIPKNLIPNLIYRDRQNNLWLANGAGLYKIDAKGEITTFTTENGLTTNFQTSIFQDRENNMWFTNEQTGLCKLSNQQLAYYPALKSTFWISDLSINPSSDSVWLYDGAHGKVHLVVSNKQAKEYSPTLPVAGLSRIVCSGDKYLFGGHNIYRWKMTPDNKSLSLIPYYSSPDSAMGFTCAVLDKYNNLVAVSNKLTVFTSNKTLVAPLHYMADQVTVDRNNRIWITHRGNELFCFEVSGSGDDAKLTLLKMYTSPIIGSPRSIVADQSGNIWIGTRDKGLYCLHLDGLKITSSKELTTVDGLSENFISYLYCDKKNTIWACTPSGLDRIKAVNNQFLIENITGASNLYFPVRKIQETTNGMFWILASEGLIKYNSNQSSINNWKPRLLFSNVVINSGQMQMPTLHELSHLQNNLVFQLAAPSYVDEKQTRFSYLLEGSNNDKWSTPAADASINFVNLPPGKYTLRAKAIFLNGLYPDAEASYTFTILPPWWQTWWFRSIAILLLAAVLIVSVRFYYRRKLEKQKIALEKQRAIEKERTRIATDMHDDLGAGLSRIKFLSETIGMKKQQHLPIEEEISSIRTYSHDMIDKMGEIVWALNEKNDSLEDLLSYTRSYAVEYLEENGIHCKVNEPEVIPDLSVSGEFRRNIYLTVKETLHNVVKHAQATEVLINIEINHLLIIDIKDNGAGIKSESITSGNGLTSMNARIQGLKGNFKIENSDGTRVNIRVPLNV